MNLSKLLTVRQPPEVTFNCGCDLVFAALWRRVAFDCDSTLQRLQSRLKHKLLLLRARKQCCNANVDCLAEQFALKNKEQERRSCFRAKKQPFPQKLVKSFWGGNLNLTISSAFQTFNLPLSIKQHWSCKRSNISCQTCHLQILQHSRPSSLFWGAVFLCKQKH